MSHLRKTPLALQDKTRSCCHRLGGRQGSPGLLRSFPASHTSEIRYNTKVSAQLHLPHCPPNRLFLLTHFSLVLDFRISKGVCQPCEYSRTCALVQGP